MPPHPSTPYISSLEELFLTVPKNYTADDLRTVLCSHPRLRHIELELLSDRNAGGVDALASLIEAHSPDAPPIYIVLSGAGPGHEYEEVLTSNGLATALKQLLQAFSKPDHYTSDDFPPSFQIRIDVSRAGYLDDTNNDEGGRTNELRRIIEQYPRIFIPMEDAFVPFLKRSM